MAPVPKDDPDRAHTHALVGETIEFSHGTKNSVWVMISSSTDIKLSNGNGDGQEEFVPSFSIHKHRSSPVHIHYRRP